MFDSASSPPFKSHQHIGEIEGIRDENHIEACRNLHKLNPGHCEATQQ